ncbi:asparagine synthase-related protein [Streptomyces sp. NPDC003077]|uniref:asparagine synthase-related protein n=1 Tax=Streptomyces sp. NPDC003077 TaxID=3154443 RepID=UPI0033A123E8
MFSGEWFVVLADGEASFAAARALRPFASRVIRHASGRPWLMGRWPDRAMTFARAGDARVVVAGDCPANPLYLRERLTQVRTVAEAEKVVEGMPGSYHLVASAGGRVRVQGTLAAVRRVFRARAGGAVVASDRAEILARLTEADWDPQWLALRLTGVAMPFPLHETVPWRGVRAVPADHWLELGADGQATERLRWRAPEAELSLPRGALVVRQALAAAVSARTAGVDTVSADLSGGMDSSSLAFLAARGPARVVTYRWAERDPADADARYAKLAAGRLPRARHVVDPADGPALCAGLGPKAAGDGEAGEPFGWVCSQGRIEHTARTMAGAGSRLHLTGHGGDELFRPGGHTHLHDLLRRRPLTALRQAWDYRIAARCSWMAALRALADRRTPADELAERVRHLTDPLSGLLTGMAVGWTAPLRMPLWATGEAVSAARALLTRAAAQAVPPLADWREQHEILLLARSTGVVIGQADRVSQAAGTRLAAPFLDDQVLEAALSVRPDERNRPSRYKPLLAEAMRGVVPRPLLDRGTKGEFGADFYQGLQRHRRELLDLMEDSRLAHHGLIDEGLLRRMLVRPDPTGAVSASLDATVACEVWLRAAEASAGGGSGAGSGGWGVTDRKNGQDRAAASWGRPMGPSSS